MKQSKFKVMNIKTGKVFDISETAINSLKKHNLFDKYMLFNENTEIKKIQLTSCSEPIVLINDNIVENPEVIESTFPGFTNYVETEETTTIENDNEKPKRKYKKKSK